MNEIKSGPKGMPQTLARDNDEFWKRALQLSERRLSVLASNIANADTPNYKARDIDFQAALQQAMNSASPINEAVGRPGTGTGDNGTGEILMYRVPSQGSVDGNTVDMDRERSAFAEQAVKHQFMLQKVADEYKEMDAMLKNMVG
jgi:flagellar basal-body rod protein FlgB